MRRFIIMIAVVLTMTGCSGKPVTDDQLGIMKARPFPADAAVVQAATDYLASHSAGGEPLHGIVFASFPHANPGHGECDTPSCWMVQMINSDGNEVVVHGDMLSAGYQVDIRPEHHLGYHLTDKALLGTERGQESFICLDRHAVRLV